MATIKIPGLSLLNANTRIVATIKRSTSLSFHNSSYSASSLSARFYNSTNVAIFLQNNNLCAIDSVCPHSGGPLALADIEDNFVVCPWHAYRFDLNTGKTSSCAGMTMKIFKVEKNIEDDSILLSMDSDGEFELVSHHIIEPKQLNLKKKKLHQVQSTDPKIEDQNSLVQMCIKVLNTADPTEKVSLALEIAKKWKNREINNIGHGIPPIAPLRQDSLNFVTQSKTKKRGNAGSLESRIAILHAIGNIEIWAIDLAFDIIARFAHFSMTESGFAPINPSPTTQISQLDISQTEFSNQDETVYSMPVEFFDDFVRIAGEEAKHFDLVARRLEELGSHFGALPVHGGLWDSALETKDDLLDRLAIVHMVHEARGLDVNPQTISKFERAGDTESVARLTIIHQDEITHVAAGQRWFSFACNLLKKDRYEQFHEIVRSKFRGMLKPPFNHEDRIRAGVDKGYYLPVSSVGVEDAK
ncbi:hypothetical protein HK098_005045 [Nowakowskiella sp. JEL0407]|nr:hypothetical protein HK098_005045 [Nowakowskiella sp. JEL0407]